MDWFAYKEELNFLGEIKPVSEELRERIENGGWPIHNMKAHDADGRRMRFIGWNDFGDCEGHRQIICLYEDEFKEIWNETRVFMPDGRIVNRQVYFLGKEWDRPRIENDDMVPRRWRME